MLKAQKSGSKFDKEEYFLQSVAQEKASSGVRELASHELAHYLKAKPEAPALFQSPLLKSSLCTPKTDNEYNQDILSEGMCRTPYLKGEI